MLCNSDLDLQDLAVAKAVRDAALTEHWNETQIDVDANRWELCAQVLSRRDIVERMAQPW